jgi:hypothetical protein
MSSPSSRQRRRLVCVGAGLLASGYLLIRLPDIARAARDTRTLLSVDVSSPVTPRD